MPASILQTAHSAAREVLPGCAATTQHPNRKTGFRTDSDRLVQGGGGIIPDLVVYPEAVSRLRAVLDASGSFTSFATEYTQRHPNLTETFDVTAAVLDEFQVYCSARNIRPGVEIGRAHV